jgi:hypothetical protein
VPRRIVIGVATLAVLAAACSSGPSATALAQNRAPQATTTTEPPPEGVLIVRITNGAFRPSNLKIDCSSNSTVEFRHEDSADREYVLAARGGEFESPPLGAGDSFQFEICALDPGIYRYFAFLGNNRIPGSIDSRPNQ